MQFSVSLEEVYKAEGRASYKTVSFLLKERCEELTNKSNNTVRVPTNQKNQGQGPKNTDRGTFKNKRNKMFGTTFGAPGEPP